MGCDCCKVVAPSDYELCQKLQERRGEVIAPCGGTTVGKGSNYTPPKKKKRKKKK